MKLMVKSARQRQPPQRMVHVRGANRALVLQILRKHRQISRAELARRTGLSEGTISRIAAGLIAERLILERGAANSTGGRPGLCLELDQTHIRSVGVEIHDAYSRIAVGNLNGAILADETIRNPGSASRTLDAIAAHVMRLRDAHGGTRLYGAGVSVRGIVNDIAGVIELGSTPDWNGIPIRDYLESRIGCSVWVENNVRAAALAEYTYGGAEIHNSHCMLLVRVDEGVGMGIMLDGRLYRGPHRSSGEFGQMVIADSPGAGAHDRPGCLELLAANPAILMRYAALKTNAARTLRGDPDSKVRTICHRAMDGDPHATLAIRECMRHLGIGIANVVWGLDPDVVLIHGAVTEAWPVVLSAIQEQFPAGREFLNFRDLILRPCALGQDAGMTGALTLPFVRLFATGQTEERRRASAAVST